MKLEYPKALYHRTLPVALVHDPIEHAALGDGWAEEPYPVTEADAAPVDEPTTETPAADDLLPAGFDTLAAEIVALNAKDAIDLLASIEAPEALAAVDAAERAGRGRSTVLSALEARIAAVGAAL